MEWMLLVQITTGKNEDNTENSMNTHNTKFFDHAITAAARVRALVIATLEPINEVTMLYNAMFLLTGNDPALADDIVARYRDVTTKTPSGSGYSDVPKWNKLGRVDRQRVRTEKLSEFIAAMQQAKRDQSVNTSHIPDVAPPQVTQPMWSRLMLIASTVQHSIRDDAQWQGSVYTALGASIKTWAQTNATLAKPAQTQLVEQIMAQFCKDTNYAPDTAGFTDVPGFAAMSRLDRRKVAIAKLADFITAIRSRLKYAPD